MADHTGQTRQALRTRIWRYAPLFFWMAVIFFASTGTFSGENTSRLLRPFLLWLFPEISEERIAFFHFLTRKLAHFAAYTVLGLLAARAFASSSQRPLREHWIIASAILVVAYAFLDEFHQSFVTSRTASIWDCFIDIAGGLFALICLNYLKRPRTKYEYPYESLGDR